MHRRDARTPKTGLVAGTRPVQQQPVEQAAQRQHDHVEAHRRGCRDISENAQREQEQAGARPTSVPVNVASNSHCTTVASMTTGSTSLIRCMYSRGRISARAACFTEQGA